jgi:hypothetical protein
MPNFIKRAALVILLATAIVIIIFTEFGASGRYYDCGMAEWHPDIPNKVKEECRRLHYEEWKRQQQEELNKKVINN